MSGRLIDERDGYYRPRAEPPEPSYGDCDNCEGEGWYVGHSDECNEWVGCVCSGVQVECERCGGSGRVGA